MQARKGSTRISGDLSLNGTAISDPQLIVDSFADVFSSVFTPALRPRVTSSYPDLPSFSVQHVTEDLVSELMGGLSSKHTSGDDMVPSFLVRDVRFIMAVPITKIINLAISTSAFPTRWKCARIVPVFKKGDAAEITNYRPIAILSNFAKVFEQVLYTSIYTNTRSFISSKQHGFMSGRSTVTNLACFTQYVCEVLDGQGQVDVVYTDFSRAFDCINHHLLLVKLEHFGLSPKLLHLMQSYLCNRSSYVFYNGFHSYYFSATSGVPQGSNLGPLLFTLYINDLLMSLTCGAVGYADDLKIFSAIRDENDRSILQLNIDHIVEWSSENYLTLNIDKCHTMSYTRKVQPLLGTYVMDGQLLERVDSISDLGVTFDMRLNFNKHIENICASSSRSLGWIIRATKCFNGGDLLTRLYFAFIVSKLEYASVVWYPYYATQYLPVERIQRRFLKYLSFKVQGIYPVRNCSYDELLSTHNLQSLSARRQKHSATFLYKLLNNRIDCSDLLSGVKLHVPRSSSRCVPTFALDTPRSNILLRAPLSHMVRNAERVYSDIFTGESSL